MLPLESYTLKGFITHSTMKAVWVNQVLKTLSVVTLGRLSQVLDKSSILPRRGAYQPHKNILSTFAPALCVGFWSPFYLCIDGFAPGGNLNDFSSKEGESCFPQGSAN